MSPNDSQFIGHDRCIGRKLFEQKKLVVDFEKKLQIKLPVEFFIIIDVLRLLEQTKDYIQYTLK